MRTETYTRLQLIEHSGQVAQLLKDKQIDEAKKTLGVMHTTLQGQALGKNLAYLQAHGLHTYADPGMIQRLKDTSVCVLSDAATLWLSYPILSTIGGALILQTAYHHPISSALFAGVVTIIDLVLD